MGVWQASVPKQACGVLRGVDQSGLCCLGVGQVATACGAVSTAFLTLDIVALHRGTAWTGAEDRGKGNDRAQFRHTVYAELLLPLYEEASVSVRAADKGESAVVYSKIDRRATQAVNRRARKPSVKMATYQV